MGKVKNMNQTHKLKEAEHKIVNFLKEEFARLKADCHEELQKKRIKQKNKDKRRQKLYQKIEATLHINSLDAETIAALRSLQQEIKNENL